MGTLFGSRNRLAIVDVRQPDAPKLQQTLTGPAYCTFAGSFANNHFVAAAWSTSALHIFDVSQMSEVKQIGRLEDARLAKPNRCVVIGDRAYLPMAAGHGVAAVDISNPAQPRWLHSRSDPLMEKAYGIAARGELLFVGSREGDSLTILHRRHFEP